MAEKIIPFNMIMDEDEIKAIDPVRYGGALCYSYRTGKYYFWSETWSELIGPYDTEGDVGRGISDYAKWLDTKGGK